MASAEIEALRGRVGRELDRIVKVLEGLDEQAVNWKPSSPSANTLLVLATHTISAAEDHVVHFVAGQPVARSRDSEFTATGSAQGIKARAEEVKRRMVEALEGFDPARLADERETPLGKRTGRDMLIHAVAHASEHAGQAELTRDLYIAKRGST